MQGLELDVAVCIARPGDQGLMHEEEVEAAEPLEAVEMRKTLEREARRLRFRSDLDGFGHFIDLWSFEKVKSLKGRVGFEVLRCLGSLPGNPPEDLEAI